MLGIGFSEVVVIALVCFIAIGPKQLPLVLRKVAGFYRQFVSLRDELRFQILSADNDMREPEKKSTKAPEIITKDQEVVAMEKKHG